MQAIADHFADFWPLYLIALVVLLVLAAPILETLWESFTGCEDDYETRTQKRDRDHPLTPTPN